MAVAPLDGFSFFLGGGGEFVDKYKILNFHYRFNQSIKQSTNCSMSTSQSQCDKYGCIDENINLKAAAV
jgi:hypothetical protein